MPDSIQNSTFTIQNLFWPLIVIGVGVVALLGGLEVFPPGVADLIGRAWPALLVLVGLAALLDLAVPARAGVLRRFTGLIALAVAVLLPVIIAAVAFSSRASTERTDQVVPIREQLTSEVERLRVVIAVEQTRVDIGPADPGLPFITGEFTGSTASEVAQDYTLAGDTATYTLTETRPAAVPALEAVGRGRLSVLLPVGVPVDLEFRGAEGTTNLSLFGLDVTRLAVELASGDLSLALPEVQLAARASALVAGGDVALRVPAGSGLHLFATSRGEPQLPPGTYFIDPDDDSFLLPRDFDDMRVQNELTLTVPAGTITVEVVTLAGE